MADNPPKRQQSFAEYLKVEASLIERRRKLFEALNEFISQQGSWVTSLPNAPRLRIETRRGSNLVAKLIGLGYSPRHCGVGTRLTPGNTPETIFSPVDILEISLLGK